MAYLVCFLDDAERQIILVRHIHTSHVLKRISLLMLVMTRYRRSIE